MVSNGRMKGYTYREFLKILNKNGWYRISQTGTHAKFRKEGDTCKNSLIIPRRDGEVSRPLVKRTIKELGLEV